MSTNKRFRKVILGSRELWSEVEVWKVIDGHWTDSVKNRKRRMKSFEMMIQNNREETKATFSMLTIPLCEMSDAFRLLIAQNAIRKLGICINDSKEFEKIGELVEQREGIEEITIRCFSSGTSKFFKFPKSVRSVKLINGTKGEFPEVDQTR